MSFARYSIIMPRPEDHDYPPADPRVTLELATVLEYLGGGIDAVAAAERLGPQWSGRAGDLRFLSNSDHPEPSPAEQELAERHAALRKAWLRRWAGPGAEGFPPPTNEGTDD